MTGHLTLVFCLTSSRQMSNGWENGIFFSKSESLKSDFIFFLSLTLVTTQLNIIFTRKIILEFSQALSLIKLQVTSNYYSWLKFLPSIWTVQLVCIHFLNACFTRPVLHDCFEVFNNRIFKRRHFKTGQIEQPEVSMFALHRVTHDTTDVLQLTQNEKGESIRVECWMSDDLNLFRWRTLLG